MVQSCMPFASPVSSKLYCVQLTDISASKHAAAKNLMRFIFFLSVWATVQRVVVRWPRLGNIAYSYRCQYVFWRITLLMGFPSLSVLASVGNGRPKAPPRMSLNVRVVNLPVNSSLM